MKKTLLLVAVFCTFISSYSVQAASLGSLNYWYAYHDGVEYDAIARWTSAPKTIAIDVDGFSYSTLNGYVNFARNKWRDAGISISSTTQASQANFKIYGGTYSELYLIDSRLPSGFAGWTDWGNSTFEGTYDYNGTSKYGLIQTGANVYIIHDSQSTTYFNSLVLHEMGHGLGWRGHSNSGSDVMYHNPTLLSPTTLSSNDKNHILQVY